MSICPSRYLISPLLNSAKNNYGHVFYHGGPDPSYSNNRDMTTETWLMNYPQCKADSLVYDVIEHRPDISWDMSFGCQKDGFDESIFNFVIGFFFTVDVFDLLKLDIY